MSHERTNTPYIDTPVIVTQDTLKQGKLETIAIAVIVNCSACNNALTATTLAGRSTLEVDTCDICDEKAADAARQEGREELELAATYAVKYQLSAILYALIDDGTLARMNVELKTPPSSEVTIQELTGLIDELNEKHLR